MFFALLIGVAIAAPTFHGTLAADGHYTLRIVPDRGWESAEMYVQGGGTTELGVAESGVPVLIEGWTDLHGPLRVTLIAAERGGRGVTHMIEVDPFRVPASPPAWTDRRAKSSR